MQAEKCMVNRYTFVGKHACTIARNRSGSVSVSKDSVILNTGREIGSSQHIVKETVVPSWRIPSVSCWTV